MQPVESINDPEASRRIDIHPLTAQIPTGVPTDMVMLRPRVPVPAPVLEDEDWPKVRGYELLTVIGTGGMGIVYMARQIDLQRTVALKMLRGIAQIDSEYRERLKAEAETVAKLQHPNIIQVFEIGSIEPQAGEQHPSPFISFEFVDGGNLLQRTEAPQAPAYAAQIIEKVARAVHAAHRLGVIHRDLKPANVLLTREGEPKVADFGLAKSFGDELDSAGRFLTRAGVVMGTPAYMAPEQAAGDILSPAIDIYALGVILYELLTAGVPFQGTSPVETMYLVRDQEPVSPRQLQPKLPRDLETICLKCLQKQIHNRYQSAEALADDLARWREGRPIQARPVGLVERTARAARRNPAIAALSALVVLVTFAGISGVLWKWQEALAHASAADQATIKAKEAAAEAELATQAERWERYRSNIVAAANAFQSNNVVAARQALESAPEKHRGWEWHYYYQQLDGSSQTLRWPDAVFSGAQFSQDGNKVCVHTYGGQRRIWDLLQRKELRTYPPKELPFSLKFSPDGMMIATTGPENSYVLRDIATAQVTVLPGHEFGVADGTFSNDSSHIMTLSKNGTFRRWDTTTGKLLRSVPFDGRATNGGVLCPDGEHALMDFVMPKAIKLWNINTGTIVPLHGEKYDNYSSTFNTRGDQVLTIEAFPNNNFQTWTVPEGKPIATFKGHANELKAIKYNPTNTLIASASIDQTARIWDASNGKSLAILREHKGWVNDLAFNSDGERLVTASQDQTLRLWRVADGAPLAVLRGHTGEVQSVAYGDKGRFIVSSASDGTVRLWDPKQVERSGVIRGHKKFVYGVAFHPDNERVASASWDGTVRLWNATSGDEIWSRSHGDQRIVSYVAFHPGGKLLASFGRNEKNNTGGGVVCLRNADTGDEVHRWDVAADWRDSRLTFSPNGELIAIGSKDGGVRIWKISDNSQVAVLRAAEAAIRDVAISPNGRWLAVGYEDESPGIHVWDLTSQSLVQTLRGHKLTVYSLCFSPDGKQLASGSTDHTVRLWDTSTWQESAVLKHGANVYCVKYTPDGSRLVSACADNTIRFWDLKTKNEVAELRGHDAYVHSIAFSPDGTRLVSGSGDSTLRIWDTVSPQIRSQLK